MCKTGTKKCSCGQIKSPFGSNFVHKTKEVITYGPKRGISRICEDPLMTGCSENGKLRIRRFKAKTVERKVGKVLCDACFDALKAKSPDDSEWETI